MQGSSPDNRIRDHFLPETAPGVEPAPAVIAARIKDQPLNERPRERLVAQGPETLKTEELIAILLRTGLKGVNVVQISQQLLHKYGSLSALAKTTPQELCTIKGIGQDKAVTLLAAFSLARRMAAEIRLERPVIDNPESVAETMREEVRSRTTETFFVLLLDTRRRLMQAIDIANGTLDTLLVHPREVFRPAISWNASAVVLLHNHPSGDPTPSEADIKVTRDLIRAGQLLKIEVLDHVILGEKTSQRPKDYVSLKELGYFY